MWRSVPAISIAPAIDAAARSPRSDLSSPNRRLTVATTMLLAVFFGRTAIRIPLGSFARVSRLSMFAMVGSKASPRATVIVLL